MEGHGRGRAPSPRPWWGPPRLGGGSRELEGWTSCGRVSRPCGNRRRAWRPRRHRRPKNGTPMTTSSSPRPPLPLFDRDAAIQKVRLAEDAWNTRDPARVATGYTPDSVRRNRAGFLAGREAIVQFLARKWARELDYRLIKELWAFYEKRIAVRFAYEWRDDSGHWFRSYGNENWEFDGNGLMARRIASINDLRIHETDRQYRRPLGRRPDGHPGLSDLGL